MNDHQAELWHHIVVAQRSGNLTEMMRLIADFESCERGCCRQCGVTTFHHLEPSDLVIQDGVRL